MKALGNSGMWEIVYIFGKMIIGPIRSQKEDDFEQVHIHR
jgi:hypothetical protein